VPKEPGDHFDHPERPTVAEPVGGQRRSPLKPALITLLVFAVLIGLYLLGTEFLVSAD
jgi:hypothetical protein